MCLAFPIFVPLVEFEAERAARTEEGGASRRGGESGEEGGASRRGGESGEEAAVSSGLRDR